jgi:hypothetical protein
VLKNFYRYLLFVLFAQMIGISILLNFAVISRDTASINKFPDLVSWRTSTKALESEHAEKVAHKSLERENKIQQRFVRIAELAAVLGLATGYFWDLFRKRFDKNKSITNRFNWLSQDLEPFLVLCCFMLLPIILSEGCSAIGETKIGIGLQTREACNLILYSLISFLTVIAITIFDKTFRLRFLVAIVPVLLPLTALIWGQYWHDVRATPLFQSHGWQNNILDLMFYMFFPVAGYVIYTCRGRRKLFAALMIIQFVVSLVPYVIAATGTSGAYL